MSNAPQEETLRLIPLLDGKLVLVERPEQIKSKGEFLAAVHRAGVIDGILQECLALFARGEIQQIPVARAYYHDEPPVFDLHFGFHDNEQDILAAILAGQPVEALQERYQVQKNSRLLSVREPFCTVLRMPDGKKIKINNLANTPLNIFCGKNAVAFQDAIITLIDGSVHQSRSGKVQVYPQIEIGGVGEIHGKIEDEAAVVISGDVHSHSYLESPSNIFVHGTIHSSFIKAGGNIQAMEGFDNTKEVDSSRIVAGANLLAPFAKKYRLIAGDKIIISGELKEAIAVSQGQVWANRIIDSEIRVRQGIVANQISGQSQIFLGPSFLKNTKISEYQKLVQIAEKKLFAKEYLIAELQDKLDKEKQALLNYLLRLRQVAKKKQVTVDSTMERLFSSLQATFNSLKMEVENYQKRLEEYFSHKLTTAYYQRELDPWAPPYIQVYGRVESGVTISAAGQTVRVNKPLEHVIIVADPISGKISFRNEFPDRPGPAAVHTGVV